MRRQCLTGPRIVAAITQSDCGVAVGLLRGVALWAFVDCADHAYTVVAECEYVECECVVSACVAFGYVDGAW